MNGNKAVKKYMNPKLFGVLEYWQKRALSRGLDLHNTNIQEMAAKYLENLEPKFEWIAIPKSKEREITLRIIPKKKKNEPLL